MLSGKSLHSLGECKKHKSSLPLKIRKFTTGLNNTMNTILLRAPNSSSGIILSTHKSFTKVDPKRAPPPPVKVGSGHFTKNLKSLRGSEMKEYLLNNPDQRKNYNKN